MSLRGAPACGRQVATRQSREIKHLQNARLLRSALNPAKSGTVQGFARNDNFGGPFVRASY